jgi:hypothetical protein
MNDLIPTILLEVCNHGACNVRFVEPSKRILGPLASLEEFSAIWYVVEVEILLRV